MRQPTWTVTITIAYGAGGSIELRAADLATKRELEFVLARAMALAEVMSSSTATEAPTAAMLRAVN